MHQPRVSRLQLAYCEPRNLHCIHFYTYFLFLVFSGVVQYSSAGTLTCAGYPASLDHEFDDAKTFASWGVDYVKYVLMPCVVSKCIIHRSLTSSCLPGTVSVSGTTTATTILGRAR